VAAISGVLAKNFTPLRADQATLAGLTHTIGVLPILAWAEENSSMLQDSLTLDKVIENIQGSLGTMILQRWGFPDEIALVPSHYTAFSRVSDRVDYVDVVMVANLQRLSGTDHPYTRLDWSQIHAFENIGLDPTADSSEMADFEEDVAAAKESIV
jgi:HD-like signal output (HDOD) protein